MKTLIQKEGINFSVDHPYGNPKDHFYDFHFFLSYEVNSVYDEGESRLYYAKTDDGYIQVCITDSDENYASIIAQYKLTDDSIKVQIQNILKKYFIQTRYCGGYPYKYLDGVVYSEVEFNKFLKDLEDHIESNRIKAREDPPEMVKICKLHHLDPIPDGKDVISWLCICPRCRRHLLTFYKGYKGWYCLFCQLSGTGIQEFESALKIINKKKADEEKEKKEEIEKAAVAAKCEQPDHIAPVEKDPWEGLTQAEKNWLFWLSNY